MSRPTFLAHPAQILLNKCGSRLDHLQFSVAAALSLNASSYLRQASLHSPNVSGWSAIDMPLGLALCRENFWLGRPHTMQSIATKPKCPGLPSSWLLIPQTLSFWGSTSAFSISADTGACKSAKSTNSQRKITHGTGLETDDVTRPTLVMDVD